MHQTQLPERIVFRVDIAAVERVQDILCPGNEKPYDCAFLIRERLHDHLRAGPRQKDCLTARQQTSEPVHLGPRVIQRRDAKEHIIPGLSVMILFAARGMSQRTMLVQDRLRKTGRTRRKIDSAVIVIGQFDPGITARIIGYFAVVSLGVPGTAVPVAVADIKQQSVFLYSLGDLVQPLDKFNAKEQYRDISQIHTVLDLIRRVAEIERYGYRPAF